MEPCCSCRQVLAANRPVYVSLSENDLDLATKIKVSGAGKAFIGVHESRRGAATVIAERMLNRLLGKDDRVVFFDRNRLHLCRQNIAVVSVSDRTRSHKPKAGGSSKYKGVSWQKSRNKWYSQIRINGRCKNLGRYNDEREAAIAYNRALKTLGIEVAYLNDVK